MPISEAASDPGARSPAHRREHLCERSVGRGLDRQRQGSACQRAHQRGRPDRVDFAQEAMSDPVAELLRRSCPALAGWLSPASAGMAGALVARRPDLDRALRMAPRDDGTFDLVVALGSPTGDAGRIVVLWMEGDEPSVGFGPWHTHGGCLASSSEPGDEYRAIADLIDAILSDRTVLITDVGGNFPGAVTVLDLREADALAEELTSPYSSGRLRLESWGGTVDREWCLDDLAGA